MRHAPVSLTSKNISTPRFTSASFSVISQPAIATAMLPKISNLNPQDRLREGSKLGAGKALHASDEVLGALGFDWTRSGIERGAGQEVGCEGVPIASRAGSPIQTPELALDQVADRFLILGHGTYASPRFLEDK